MFWARQSLNCLIPFVINSKLKHMGSMRVLNQYWGGKVAAKPSLVCIIIFINGYNGISLF